MAANRNEAIAIKDVKADAVDTVMTKHAVKVLIHGHTHRPDRHPLEDRERIVLGDWERFGWALSLDKAGYNLESFPIDAAGN